LAEGPDAWRLQLAEPELEEIWQRRVQGRLFLDAEPSASPRLVLLGGQPGAGKTVAGAVAAGDEDLRAIIGDDFRRYHPQYLEVLERDPLRMPDVTAAAARWWTNRSIEHAFTEQISVLVEGTWREPAVPERTTAAAAAAGFDVEAIALGVPPALSRLSTLERYYRDAAAGQPARWTPSQAHEQAVASDAPVALGSLPAVSRVRVMDRAGVESYTDGRVNASELRGRGERFLHAVRARRKVPLSTSEATRWLETYRELRPLHDRLTPTEPDAIATWARVDREDLPVVQRWVTFPVALRPERDADRGSQARPAGPCPRQTGLELEH